MNPGSQPDSPPKRRKDEHLAVRFPSSGTIRRPKNGLRPLLNDLLPQRWRRQVVIQGQRFWLPG